MERAYFIYSDDYKIDNELVKKLHRFLPMNIDIIKGKIKNKYFLDLEGKLEKKQMPDYLIENERPIYASEDALDELINIEQCGINTWFFSKTESLEFLKIKQKNLKSLVLKLVNEKRIISGRADIISYIKELEKGFYPIF